MKCRIMNILHESMEIVLQEPWKNQKILRSSEHSRTAVVWINNSSYLLTYCHPHLPLVYSFLKYWLWRQSSKITYFMKKLTTEFLVMVFNNVEEVSLQTFSSR
jgi:hypothetical protein